MKRRTKKQDSKNNFFEVVEIIPIPTEDLDSYIEDFKSSNKIDVNTLLNSAKKDGISLEDELVAKLG